MRGGSNIFYQTLITDPNTPQSNYNCYMYVTQTYFIVYIECIVISVSFSLS